MRRPFKGQGRHGCDHLPGARPPSCAPWTAGAAPCSLPSAPRRGAPAPAARGTHASWPACGGFVMPTHHSFRCCKLCASQVLHAVRTASAVGSGRECEAALRMRTGHWHIAAGSLRFARHRAPTANLACIREHDSPLRGSACLLPAAARAAPPARSPQPPRPRDGPPAPPAKAPGSKVSNS